MKIVKKLIALLTAATMIIGLLSLAGFAQAAQNGPYNPTGDKAVGSCKKSTTSGRYSTYIDGDRASATTRGNVYYKYDLPKLPAGHCISKATLTFDYVTTSTNSYLKFYPVEGNWSDAITWDNQPLSMEQSGYPSGEPAVSLRLDNTSNAVKEDVQVDITGMLNDYYSSESSNPFSFAIVMYRATGASYIAISPSDLDGCPTITFETEEVADFTFNNVTPASGSTVASDEPVVFEFNNNVDASSVTPDDFAVMDISGEPVAVTESDYVVSGNKVTLNKEWDAYGYYVVSLSGVSDVYKQTLTQTFTTSFEVAGNETTIQLSCKPLKVIKTGNETGDTRGEFETVTSTDILSRKRFSLFQIDLSSIPTDAQLIDATFKFYNNITAQNANCTDLRYVTDYQWTSDAGIDTDYLTKLETEYADSSRKLATTYAKHNWQAGVATANVTSVIKDILSSDKTPKIVTFVYKTEYTANVYNTNHATYKTGLTVKVADKSFDAVGAIPAKGASMSGVGDDIKITLATEIADEYLNNEYIKLEKIGGSAVEIDITSDGGSSYTIKPKFDLDQYSNYRIVLLEGITDKSGNVLNGDKAVHIFKSGNALDFNEIKFTYEKAPANYSVEEITSYSSGEEVTAVAEYINKTTTKRPVTLIVALYNSDGSLNKVEAQQPPFEAPAGESTLFATTITIPADAEGTYIKAFVWSDLKDIRPICPHEQINQN